MPHGLLTSTRGVSANTRMIPWYPVEYGGTPRIKQYTPKEFWSREFAVYFPWQPTEIPVGNPTETQGIPRIRCVSMVLD